MTTTLTRTLKLPSLVLFGLAYLTPIIVLGIFGIIAETTGGAAPAAYLVALVAMLFTAHSYGRMAVAHPVAGSAYTYVRRSIDPRVGFLVGWAVLLDYLFLPMVIWLIGGSYLTAQFPGIPIGVWVVGFIVITTLLNILGIKVADKANYVLMAFQLLVLVFFVALAMGNVVAANGAGGLTSGQPFFNDTASFTTISAGAAIAAYSFLGFDAVTTLTEETINPRRTVPRAIMLVALIGGGIFVAVSYVTQLVHPGGVFEDSASAASSIALQIGGQLFGAVFLAGLVVAQFASGLAAQASASRLLYAMGRDSVLPKAVFGRLSEKFHTPVANLAITGIVGLIAIFLDVATSTSFINFGAFTAFTLVNASVVFHYVHQRRAGQQLNPVSYVVVPVVGAIICAYLLSRLDSNAITLGVSWLVLGVLVLALITRGFKASPPEMTATEKATVEAAA
ncbi:APC family permease [Pseudarthrobacter sp. NIBRBAC000502771]|uniref:APC family permease n=1 Tax=Pseudarthrobacter sp. NIBRBAC000502771 TaxID=2590774 RepID=UPI0011304B5C|nr:APC family permease [Pseudarthrobacter sp. NIBRBAC000502771]QDG64434.1 APC family permease [Pseudarthrobacter sp. NIBRBAC000502771]